MSGLTSSGFERKRLPEIKAEIEAGLKTAFGDDINLSPDSIFGQIVGVFAEREASIWEILEAVYLSQYRSTAEGFSLDFVAELAGISRLSELATSVIVALEGDEGTLVPQSTRVKISDTNEAFDTLSDTTITANDVIKAKVYIADGSTPNYPVTINGNDYTSTTSGDADVIAGELKTAIEAGETGISCTISGGTVSAWVTIEADDSEYAFSVAVNANLDLVEIWGYVQAQAIVAGAVLCPIGAIDTIVTPVSGLNTVDNIYAGVTGRDRETDTELRVRIANASATGAGTVLSIESRLVNEVDGVTNAYVRENRETAKIVNFESGGTYTAGAINATVNGVTTASVPYNTNKTTTLNDLATAIEALAEVVSAEYVSAENRLTIVVSTDARPTFSVNISGITGTMTFDAVGSFEAPSHSIETFVHGGDDNAVASKLWELKPAGIETVGTTTEIVTDSSGDDQSVSFSRPITRYAWIDIELVLNDEETFPTDGIDQIKALLLVYGQSLTVGDDFIIQRLYGYIYQVTGIDSVTLTIATTATAGGTPSYGSSNIAVGENEILDFDLDRIEVTIP